MPPVITSTEGGFAKIDAQGDHHMDSTDQEAQANAGGGATIVSNDGNGEDAKVDDQEKIIMSEDEEPEADQEDKVDEQNEEGGHKANEGAGQGGDDDGADLDE